MLLTLSAGLPAVFALSPDLSTLPAQAAAGGAALVWGLVSAILSPCHLGIIPLLGSHAAGLGPFEGSGPDSSGPDESAQTGSPGNARDATRRRVTQVLLFTLGCFATIPLTGFLLALLGQGLNVVGHWWTIPVGLLLIWFGRDMFRSHVCSHAPHVWDTLRRRLGIGPQSGLLALGFAYGLLASGCTLGFLTPLLATALPQGVLVCTLLAACFGLGHTLPMAVVGACAPLARRLGHRHRAHAHSPDGQCVEHTAAGDGCLDEPHAGEHLFRRFMGAVLTLIGIGFVLHPFLE